MPTTIFTARFFFLGLKLALYSQREQGKTTGQANMVSRAVSAEIKLQFLFCT